MADYFRDMNKVQKEFRREVYRNLHWKNETVYSVRKNGLVQGHVYSPYKHKTFVTRDTNPFRSMKDVIEPIYTARKVIIGPRVWAQVPVKHENN